MKKILKKIAITISFILVITNLSYAQKGKGYAKVNNGGKHNNGNKQHNGNKHYNGNKIHNKKIIKRSVYRPKTVVVFHPGWAPKKNYNRRWVYFPRHNFYWDNWRQVYVYRNANLWVTEPTRPKVIVNINIENEKHYELKESEDDIDDVYSTNDFHTKEYNAD